MAMPHDQYTGEIIITIPPMFEEIAECRRLVVPFFSAPNAVYTHSDIAQLTGLRGVDLNWGLWDAANAYCRAYVSTALSTTLGFPSIDYFYVSRASEGPGVDFFAIRQSEMGVRFERAVRDIVNPVFVDFLLILQGSMKALNLRESDCRYPIYATNALAKMMRANEVQIYPRRQPNYTEMLNEITFGGGTDLPEVLFRLKEPEEPIWHPDGVEYSRRL